MKVIRSAGTILFSQVGFFWIVLAIFMIVSVSQLGDFFNLAITHGTFGGVLGYAVAATFDLLSLVFMLARLNAARIADKRGEYLSLFGVVICAGVSAFGNVSSALQTYDASQFSHIPAWMSGVAPYLGMVFPAMIIVVSIISDHIGDLNPQRADSIEKYRIKEQKKVALLRVRLEIERDLANVRQQMAELHSKPSKKERRVLTEALEKAMQETAEIRAVYDARIGALSDEITILKAMNVPMQSPMKQRSQNIEINDTISDEIAMDEPTTEKIPAIGKSDKKADRKPIPLLPRNKRNSPLARARKLLKNNPDMTTAEIEKRLQISQSYASELRKKVLREQERVEVAQ